MATVKAQLHEAVRRLAAAHEQEAHVRQLGTAPSVDELALEFNDAFVVERDHLDGVVLTAARQLDQYLEQISGPENEALWTVTALHEAPEWSHVRELAGEVLRHLRK